MPATARADGRESVPGASTPRRERIYLVGFMAAGKTAVGSALAECLGFGFHDLDRLIVERAGAAVPEIFEHRGESGFRDLEHRCLERTGALEGAVIATGGGTMTFERNRQLIGRLGASVWLDVPLETLFARLESCAESSRPLFRDREQARELYHSRLDAYRMADLKIEPRARETAGDVAARIAAIMRERTILRERKCVI